jgi:DtxR family Mn-dependent transcriptional regulator
VAGVENLTESLEDYLEAIWHLVREKQVARSKDIADRLGVSKSSVTGALKNLASRGLVNYEAYQFATLTEAGRKAASEIVRRHEVIQEFLARILGLPEDVAEANACRIEHALDTDALEMMLSFVEFVVTCPRTKSGWTEGFQKFCHKHPDPNRCRKCLQDCEAGLEDAMAKPDRPGAESESLADLSTGDEARIVEIRPKDAVPRRLRDKGLAPGALVRVGKAHHAGKALAVRVRGYYVDLDRAEAEAVKVEKGR